MDINKGREYLTEKDMDDYPIWFRKDDDDELIFPIYGPEDFPEESRDLFIRANFTTLTGMTLKGFIVGFQNIFCIAIFWKNEILYLNKNFIDECVEAIDKINLDLNKKLSPEDFSPLIYQTTIDLDDFNNISGEFDILKERTDAERLPGIWLDE